MSDVKLITIEATERKGFGKSYTRKLRSSGKVPGVLNYKGVSQAIEFDPKMLSKAWQSPDHVFNLVLNGQTKKVKITELQVHAVKRLPLHVDLTPVQ